MCFFFINHATLRYVSAMNYYQRAGTKHRKCTSATLTEYIKLKAMLDIDAILQEFPASFSAF